MIMELLTKLLYNVQKTGSHRFTAYHPYYKENLEIISTKFVYNLFLLQAPSKLLLLSVLSDYIIKFAIYYLYYKKKLEKTRFIYNLYLLFSNKLVSHSNWTFICTTSYLCFGYSFSHLGNLSKASFFGYNSRACIIKLNLVTKMRELLTTSLNYLFNAFQSLSLFFNLTFLKLCLTIFKYSLMFIGLAI